MKAIDMQILIAFVNYENIINIFMHIMIVFLLHEIILSDIILVVNEGREQKMTKVMVNGDLDKSLRKFKVKVARSGVPSELKKRKHYEKPGVKRRNEIKEGIKNSHKKNH